jgi:hypothetical protein
MYTLYVWPKNNFIEHLLWLQAILRSSMEFSSCGRQYVSFQTVADFRLLSVKDVQPVLLGYKINLVS